MKGPKRILVVGNGKSGSWCIRGEQLGRAIGATVDPFAENGVKGYELCIVVKRTRADVLQRLRAAGVPIVYDVVDAWPQPSGNEWNRSKCLVWRRNAVNAMRPCALVAATQAMQVDLDRLTMLPSIALPHHARPGIRRNPVRPHVKIVGYEGGAQYLGKWRALLEQECERRGWVFMINPPELADLDIVVALRESDGYAVMMYKSNVKLANAQGSGTPFIGAPEAGYLETSCGAEHWVRTPQDLEQALDALTPYETRLLASRALYAARLSLASVAEKYKAWLEDLY